ncbi:hypothetical protein [Xanthomonas maliensis]|uniref:hypothetical protein n=1 Tax=Xanthomonas maliensis TaxID=1321368 RepID=UPI0003A611F9|nr:hypothetical protein [Xanthomonas maliensis]KAB7764112.1 hypothetical protein CKY51_18655 [Xanthomonas maliensis]
MIECITQFVVELLLQALTELLIEAGLHHMRHSGHARRSPDAAVVGYVLLGASMGGISLLLLPRHLTTGEAARLAVLIGVPVLAGALMAVLGGWRERRGEQRLRLDRFSYGYLFALGFALVRFFFAD